MPCIVCQWNLAEKFFNETRQLVQSLHFVGDASIVKRHRRGIGACARAHVLRIQIEKLAWLLFRSVTNDVWCANKANISDYKKNTTCHRKRVDPPIITWSRVKSCVRSENEETCEERERKMLEKNSLCFWVWLFFSCTKYVLSTDAVNLFFMLIANHSRLWNRHTICFLSS